MSSVYPQGTAPIKAEYGRITDGSSTTDHTFHFRYVISIHDSTIPDDDAAEGNTNQVTGGRFSSDAKSAEDGNEDLGEGHKRLSGAQRKKIAREEKKKQRGQNKGRRFQKVRDELDLCWRVAAGQLCEFGDE